MIYDSNAAIKDLRWNCNNRSLPSTPSVHTAMLKKVPSAVAAAVTPPPSRPPRNRPPSRQKPLTRSSNMLLESAVRPDGIATQNMLYLFAEYQPCAHRSGLFILLTRISDQTFPETASGEVPADELQYLQCKTEDSERSSESCGMHTWYCYLFTQVQNACTNHDTCQHWHAQCPHQVSATQLITVVFLIRKLVRGVESAFHKSLEFSLVSRIIHNSSHSNLSFRFPFAFDKG